MKFLSSPRDFILKNYNHPRLLGFYQRNPRIIRLDKYKTLYFITPKVGCSSLKKFCADILNIDPEQDIHKTQFPTIKYNRLLLFRDYFKFAFVRNPWDRLLSFYKNKIEPADPFQIEKYKYFPMGVSFEEFVKRVADIPDDDPFMNWHYQSQHFLLYGPHDKLLDFVGKFENMNDDFKRILHILNIDHYTLPKKNVTKHTHYREYYSDKTRELVSQRYSIDIEKFHYLF